MNFLQLVTGNFVIVSVPIHTDAVPQPNPDVLCREIAGESVLVPVKKSAADMENIYVLTEVGKFIFDCMDGYRSAGELTDLILDRYDIDRPTALADLNAFLADLQGQGLVGFAERSSVPSSP